MSELMKKRIEKLKLMRESANRRSSLYSDITKIDDKNTGMIKFSDFLSIYYKYKQMNEDEDD